MTHQASLNKFCGVAHAAAPIDQPFLEANQRRPRDYILNSSTSDISLAFITIVCVFNRSRCKFSVCFELIQRNPSVEDL